MSRNRIFHSNTTGLIDEFDAAAEADLDTLAIDDVEPIGFDDERIAEKHGPQSGGFFAFENGPVDDFGMEDW